MITQADVSSKFQRDINNLRKEKNALEKENKIFRAVILYLLKNVVKDKITMTWSKLLSIASYEQNVVGVCYSLDENISSEPLITIRLKERE